MRDTCFLLTVILYTCKCNYVKSEMFLYASHPMSQSLGEAPFNFMMFLEKLMGEVLGHEGKHQIGSLRVWPEFLSFKKSLSQNFGIGKNRFACAEKET